MREERKTIVSGIRTEAPERGKKCNKSGNNSQVESIKQWTKPQTKGYGITGYHLVKFNHLTLAGNFRVIFRPKHTNINISIILFSNKESDCISHLASVFSFKIERPEGIIHSSPIYTLLSPPTKGNYPIGCLILPLFALDHNHARGVVKGDRSPYPRKLRGYTTQQPEYSTNNYKFLSDQEAASCL